MRLDAYLCEKGFFSSRTKAKRAIEEKRVYVFGRLADKPSFDVCETDNVDVRVVVCKDFVSLGGFKLDKALCDFGFSVQDMIAVDLGASTGGFTDCLLKNGAKKVYSVDLNDGLLDASLKNNKKVRLIIKNVREIQKSDFSDDIDLITADLSFISLTKVIKIMSDIIGCGRHVIALIKPQFEIEEKKRFKNGIIKDEKIRNTACRRIYDCAIENGFSPIKATVAPLNEKKNVEYLILMKKEQGCAIPFENLFKK